MSIIDEIKKRINIVDLATEFGLQPTKKDFIFSIYKEERNRSLKLYSETNSFYCFATGKGGDVIDFYADYYKIDFKDAIIELAVKAGIDDKKNKNTKRKFIKRKTEKVEKKVLVLKSERELFEERAGIGEFMMGLGKNKAEITAMGALMTEREETQNLIYESLEKFCYGVDEEAFEYLLGKERGLRPEIIKYFRLFSIKELGKTLEYLKDCFTNDDLIISGLINKKGNFVFTYHKLIIPYSEDNKITYLRGRCINAEIKFSKYIGLSNFSGNLSPKRFYNIDALKNISKSDKLILCEGEFDTIIMQQEGYYSIGIPGVTNIPENQIHLVKNYDVYVAFDNDEAGEKAMYKITRLINRPIKAIKLKHHKDITELINERHRR